MIDNEVVQALKDALELVILFESTLTDKKGCDGNPFDSIDKGVDRQGQIFENGLMINYAYHGSGCRLEADGAVLEYGVVPYSNSPLKITPRNTLVYMKSKTESPETHSLQSKDIHQVFERLVALGLLTLVPGSIANFEVNASRLQG